MEIQGKNALVTGGARRVGRAISLELAKAGVNIAVNYNYSEDDASNTICEAEKFGVRALKVKADISNIDQVLQMVDMVYQGLGSIDFLILNAAPFIRTPFPVEKLEDWHTVINTMVNGSFYCVNTIAPLMKQNGGGVIIFILDLSAFEPMRNYIAHSIGKASMLAMFKQLAVELAPIIRVNAVAPGQILPPEHFNEEKIKKSAHKNLLEKWGTTGDVTDTVLFLLKSDFITGEVLVVDGGERLGHRRKN